MSQTFGGVVARVFAGQLQGRLRLPEVIVSRVEWANCSVR